MSNKFIIKHLSGEKSRSEREEAIRKISRCGGALLVTYGMVNNLTQWLSHVNPPDEIVSIKTKRQQLKEDLD